MEIRIYHDDNVNDVLDKIDVALREKNLCISDKSEEGLDFMTIKIEDFKNE